ncbi:hypothetical protein [Selenomonas sp. TAMA-11512]|uniref:hypothetical protein n=1 Tax=Selenomonas sp. TAMA-11512 TaxID=3095337 RepID=UPI0030CE51D2
METMILSALLLVMVSCAFYWQQSAKLIDRACHETAAVYLVEGSLSRMENDVLHGEAAEYDADVEQNGRQYRLEGAEEQISNQVYRIKARASWEEEGTPHTYEQERMVWVNASR